MLSIILDIEKKLYIRKNQGNIRKKAKFPQLRNKKRWHLSWTMGRMVKCEQKELGERSIGDKAK